MFFCLWLLFSCLMHHQMLHTSISICFHKEKYIPLKFVIYGCAIVRLNNKQFLYKMNEFVENLNKNHYWRWFVWIVVFCTKWTCSNVRFFGFNQLHLLDNNVNSNNNIIFALLIGMHSFECLTINQPIV